MSQQGQTYTDPQQGLTARQVETRRAQGLLNTPVEAPTKTEWQIVRGHVFTFFNLIFVVLAACLFAVGSYKNTLFLLVVAANTLIGIIQELRSKHTIDKLTLLNAPRTWVIRDGASLPVPSEELVRDDVIQLSSGSQIPADAVVLTGELRVNEALLTGESDAVVKGPGDSLLSGSFVVAGKGRAVLTAVGDQSYAARLTLEAKAHHAPTRSEMMRSLDKLIRFIGIALIPMGAALFLKQYYFLHAPLPQAVTATVGALIGMIPEGLYLLTSVALAVSVIRLALRKTLVHDMASIETLARVDVLCVDKTGTITQPGMALAGVLPLAEEACPLPEVEAILASFYAAAGAENETGAALAGAFSTDHPWPWESVIPFTSETKWSAVNFTEKGSFVVGAPTFILEELPPDLARQLDHFSARGERVLLLARHRGTVSGRRLSGPLTPLAFLRLSNKVRPEAPDTFRYFDAQGVAVKVISGDDPLTVSQVALQAGIRGAENWVDASRLSDEDLARASDSATVFGRVSPGQKRLLIKALKGAGHTVAMTGDGVNDVLALKDADCSIAMASGADAACQAAQLVLLDSNFSSMPQVVLEGRRVINNIQRSAALFLVKNIFSFLLSLLTIFATNMPYPLVPIQLSLISALTIGVPSFFLALEPNRAIVKGRFLPNVLSRACPGGLTNLILVLLAQLSAFLLALPQEELSNLAALLLSVNGLVVLFVVCRPFDWKRRGLFAAMALAMVISVLFLGSFFSICLPSPAVVPAFLLLAPLSIPCQVLITLLVRSLSRRLPQGRSPSKKGA